MPIIKIQGHKKGTTISGSSIPVTLDSTPTNGNTLIAVIGSLSYPNVQSVASISQTGVTWTRQIQKQKTDNTFVIEIWLGQVGSEALASITVNLTNPNVNYPGVADVCEYSGLATSAKDQTATNQGIASTIDTGTTPPTAQSSELWIGGTYGLSDQPNGQSAPTNDFELRDGLTQLGATNSNSSLGYLEKVVAATGTANSSVSATNSNYVGCIATFKASSGQTIVVPRDGRYAGNGSKQSTIYWTSGADIIMQVESNVPSYLEKSAVIENLIIDGLDSTNVTGILLENVYNCTIRNVTIRNCDVGIKVKLTGTNWSHANRFEHIRMENVKTGILFTGTSSAKDFSYTIIDDVGISLKTVSGAVGIKIGDSYADLYSAFIKATVWLWESNGTGMEINGALKLSLVNLEVEQKSLSYTGKGLVVNSGAYEYDNQNFLLACGSIQAGNRVSGSGTIEPNTPTVKYW